MPPPTRRATHAAMAQWFMPCGGVCDVEAWLWSATGRRNVGVGCHDDVPLDGCERARVEAPAQGADTDVGGLVDGARRTRVSLTGSLFGARSFGGGGGA